MRQSRVIQYCRGIALCLLSWSLFAGCRRAETTQPVATLSPAEWTISDAPERLADLGLFQGALAGQKPAAGVIAYQINSEPFYDYAHSRRFIKLPPGQAAQYQAKGNLKFPLGTLVAQSLGYPTSTTPDAPIRWVETRVLALTSQGWLAIPFVWNVEQTAAEQEVVGERVSLADLVKAGVRAPATHIVPNFNDCKRCHKVANRVQPLALDTAQLNVQRAGKSQLAHWASTGMLTGLPSGSPLPQLVDWREASGVPVADRARSWLHANCAHCHQPRGAARNSGLYLGAEVAEPALYGVLKSPIAAGRGSGGHRYDITPGRPGDSILVHRIQSTEPGVMMPEYGRTLVHQEGVDLIRAWIADMASAENDPTLVGEVTELTPDQLADWVQRAETEGDPARGEEVLHRREMQCLQCHAIQGAGGNVGPDLATLPPDTTLAHVVESLLLPSKVVNPKFAAVTVQTVDGLVLSGVKVEEGETTLLLRDPVRGDTRLSKGQIEAIEPMGSLMPVGVVSRLKKNDFADLARFVASLPHHKPDPAAGQTIVRYETLDPLPDELIELPAAQVASFLDSAADLPWRAAFARLSGEVPARELFPLGDSPRAVARAQFETTEPGRFVLEINPSAGITAWLNGKPVITGEAGGVQLAPGKHSLVLLIDTAAAADARIRARVAPANKSET
jgi:uncharacterized repeat protein (TIGR03806 family)